MNVNYVPVGQYKGKVNVEIKQPCELNNGRHCCLSCEETFANNLQVSSHVQQGKHDMAWLCHEHGFEEV